MSTDFLDSGEAQFPENQNRQIRGFKLVDEFGNDGGANTEQRTIQIPILEDQTKEEDKWEIIDKTLHKETTRPSVEKSPQLQPTDNKKLDKVNVPSHPITLSQVLQKEIDSQRELWKERRKSVPSVPRESYKPKGFVYQLIRWPLFFGILIVIILELILYGFIRWIVAVYEKTANENPITSDNIRNPLIEMLMFPIRYLQNPPPKPKSYLDWKDRAQKADQTSGSVTWKRIDESPFYDSSLIAALAASLHHYLATLPSDNKKFAHHQKFQRIRYELVSKDGIPLDRTEQFHIFLHDLLASCKNNVGGIENEQLYSYTFYGTKYMIEDFIETVADSIDFLRESEEIENKPALFRQLSKSYGRTALCLSGGASFGYYHLGVVKCLLENGVLPKIISGTSAGALISAFVCVRTDDELRSLLNPDLYQTFQANDEGILRIIQRFLEEGSFFDVGIWEEKLKKNITMGNMTFLEAYQRTGKILNISVASDERYSPPYFLNYKTTPNVVIWSGILASAAAPGLLPPIELQIKRLKTGRIESFKTIGGRWRDGVFRADIPFTGLNQLFNVTYTIVSQVNPHVIPFFYENRGSGGSPTLHRRGKGWRGGFIASMFEDYLKLDMRKWIQFLHNLTLFPRFLGQDWSLVFLQNFAGNVTIVPNFRLGDYFKIIFDPDHDGMNHFMTSGEKKTWPKISMIQNRMKIEQALDRAFLEYPSRPFTSEIHLFYFY